MSRALNCVVAVATIQLQLASMELVTERHRLLRLMSDIDNRRMDRCEQTRRQVTTDRDRRKRREQCKLVNPSREMKLLHSIHHAKCRNTWQNKDMKSGQIERLRAPN